MKHKRKIMTYISNKEKDKNNHPDGLMQEQSLLQVNFATTDNVYLAERAPRTEE